MNESEMDHRGSKSIFKDLILYSCKRATSRWLFSIKNTVRCTLVAMKVVLSRNK
jgi:hypothetical protein